MTNKTVSYSTDAAFDLYKLKGRVAIVTGAGQGIGRVFAHAYARAGVIPVIAELNEDKAHAVAKEIEDRGGRALALKVDVSDPDSVEKMAQKTLEAFGRIDILVNNAAFFSQIVKRPFDEVPLTEWDFAFRVNVTGIFLCCRAVVGAMRKAGWGRIVNMSSSVVDVAPPNYLHYPTTKTAVVGLTRALARELGNQGITVNALMPGAILTETPRDSVNPEIQKAIIAAQSIQRAQTPEDLVGPLMFLSSEACGFLTGQSLAVNGGSSFH